jgi:hypothetical protein
MKITVKGMVLTSLAIFAITILQNPRQTSTNLPIATWRTPQVVADGGLPMPPWPNTGNVLLADGGLPMPPWPPSGNLSVKDKGNSMNTRLAGNPA